MRRTSLLPLALAIVLVVAACSSSADTEATSDPAAESDTSVGTEGEGSESTEGTDAASDDVVDDADFDYSAIDYAAEPAGSALRGNRFDDAFPPPVVDPGLIIPVILPDQIFPVDEPTYAPAEEIDYPISDEEAVLAVEIDGDARAYPVQIMIYHEIVNTEIGGIPVSVTYCPLCNSALTFDRRFGDRILDFGTSGELYQSALVMYDRQTESLWSHFLGQGLIGHFAGAELDLIPTQTISYGEWKAANPDGLVLTRDLGAPERYQSYYGQNPYGGYDFEAADPIGGFFIGEIDRTLLAKARIVGITDDGGPIAVRFEDLIETPVIPVTEGGRNLVVFFRTGLASSLDSEVIADGRDVGQTGVFVPVAPDGTDLTFAADGDGFVDAETGSTWNIQGHAIDGPLTGEQLEPVVHTNTFWFAWATYQPGTTIIEP